MSFIREIEDRYTSVPALPDFDRYRLEAERLRRAEQRRVISAVMSRLGRLLTLPARSRPARGLRRAPGQWVAE